MSMKPLILLIAACSMIHLGCGGPGVDYAAGPPDSELVGDAEFELVPPPPENCPLASSLFAVAYLMNGPNDTPSQSVGSVQNGSVSWNNTYWYGSTQEACGYTATNYIDLNAPKVNGSCPTRYIRQNVYTTESSDENWWPYLSSGHALSGADRGSYCAYFSSALPGNSTLRQSRVHNCRSVVSVGGETTGHFVYATAPYTTCVPPSSYPYPY